MKSINKTRILVVGDIMIDKYVVGEVERISPEAPVPVVKVIDEYVTLGGCGNVVRNIRETGAQASCLTSVAWDDAGEQITTELLNIGAKPLIVNESDVTTMKERIIADQRKIQMIRVDRETIKPIDPNLLINRLTEQRAKYDIIVISDYAKGVVSWDLIQYLERTGTPVIIDPKPQNSHLYNIPFMITPNKHEWELIEPKDEIRPDFVLVTEGRDGMTLIDYSGSVMGTAKIEAEPVEVYNVSGAGDTVVAIMSVCLASGLDPLKSATVANKCAGYVVTQTGTSTVPKNIFMEHYDEVS